MPPRYIIPSFKTLHEDGCVKLQPFPVFDLHRDNLPLLSITITQVNNSGSKNYFWRSGCRSRFFASHWAIKSESPLSAWGSFIHLVMKR
jgi:hypothetical protein